MAKDEGPNGGGQSQRVSQSVGVAGCGIFLWGKSRGLPEPYPLVAHLLDAAAAAQVLSAQLLSDQSGSWLSQVLGTGSGETPEVSQLLGLLGSWHDIGKVSPGFQSADPAAAHQLSVILREDFNDSPQDVRHDRVGQLAVAAHEYGSLFAAAVVGGHHGQFAGLRASHAQVLLDRVGGSSAHWHQLRSELLELTRTLTGPVPVAPRSALGLLLVTGFVSIADWLVSEEQWLIDRSTHVPSLELVDGPRDWFRQSRGLLEDRLANAGLGRGPMKSRSFGELFSGWEARGLQAETERVLTGADLGPGGIVAIMAPTGDGKTEAGLLAAGILAEASGRSGLYVALPTMATADQMLGRVRAFVADQTDDALSITLNHGLASLDLGSLTQNTSVSGESATRFASSAWLRGRHRAMLAPVAVGTIDQVLVAALAVRYGFIRHVALFDKVLIIDEAHAYDPYMQALLVRAMEWFGAYQVPVVLLSATLPTKTARTLFAAYQRGWYMDPDATIEDNEISYPGLAGWLPDSGSFSSLDPNPSGRQVTVTQVRYDGERDQIAAVLGQLDEVYGADFTAGVAIVVNTVKAAQKLFDAVRDRFADETLPVWLLHSRFTIGDRAHATNEIVTHFGKDSVNRAGVVIATQVIEQSLDLDFDLMISELAPVAQLLQRVGRCHRHQRSRRPQTCAKPSLRVLTPWSTDSGLSLPRSWKWIYHEVELRRTEALLGEHRSVQIPQDVQDLVDQVDAADFSDPDAAIAAAETERFASNAQDRAIAGQVLIPSPWNVDLTNQDALTSTLDADQFAATRLGAPSVLVVFLDQDQALFDGLALSPDPNHHEVRRIIVNAVPVPGYPGSWINKATKAEAPAGWEKWSRLRDVFLISGERRDEAIWASGEDWSVKLTHEYGLEEL